MQHVNIKPLPDVGVQHVNIKPLPDVGVQHVYVVHVKPLPDVGVQHVNVVFKPLPDVGVQHVDVVHLPQVGVCRGHGGQVVVVHHCDQTQRRLICLHSVSSSNIFILTHTEVYSSHIFAYQVEEIHHNISKVSVTGFKFPLPK